MSADIDAVLADNDTAIAQAKTPLVTAREGTNLNAALDAFRNGDITREQAEAAGLTMAVMDDELECRAVQSGTDGVLMQSASMANNGRVGMRDAASNGVFRDANGEIMRSTALVGPDATPWDRLARRNGVVNGRYMSVTEAMERAGVLYRIEDQPLPGMLGGYGTSEAVSKLRAFYRTDTRATIAIGGQQFTAWQPQEVGELGEKVMGYGSGTLLVSSVAVLGDVGERFVISFVMPDDLVLDVTGAADHVRFFLNLTDWCDGHHSLRIDASPWRMDCDNTNRFSLADAASSISFSHRPGIHDQLVSGAALTDKAHDVLNFLGRYRAAYQTAAEEMIQTPMTKDQAHAIMAETFPAEGMNGQPPSEKTIKAQARIIERIIDEIHGGDSQRNIVEANGMTAWSVLNAGTRYIDHEAAIRMPSSARERGIEEGTYRDILVADPDSGTAKRKEVLYRAIRKAASAQLNVRR
jgi:hypothetical protein